MLPPALAPVDGPRLSEADLASIAAEADPLKRLLRFVALLDKTIGAPSPCQRPIIVGGSAVEIYTTGGYTSQDIDLIVLDPRPYEHALAASGFTKEGRHWFRPGLDLLVEFPGHTLTYAPSAYDRVVTIDLEPDACALVIGIEDILIGRIYSGISEQRANDLKWATEMAAIHHHRIDWQAVDVLAAQNGPATVEAVARIRIAIENLPRLTEHP